MRPEVSEEYAKRVAEAKFRPLDGLRTDMPPDQIAGLCHPRRHPAASVKYTFRYADAVQSAESR